MRLPLAQRGRGRHTVNVRVGWACPGAAWLSAILLIGCQGRLVHGPSGAAGSSGAGGIEREDAERDGQGGTDNSGGSKATAETSGAEAGGPHGTIDGTTSGAAGRSEPSGTGGDTADGGRATGGASEDAGGAGGIAPTGGTTGTGGTWVTGGSAGTGGVPSTGGAVTTGGSPDTGGNAGTGVDAGTGGTLTAGTAGTGGGAQCTGTETRGSCPEGREKCVDGTWVPDLSCYSEACDLLTCPDDTSDCCLGWGRSGVDSSDYQPDESIVTSFSLEQEPTEHFSATFQFVYPNDIGAITLYLAEPVAWGALTAVEIDVLFGGDPSPTLEVSIEDGVANHGGIWWPGFIDDTTFGTSLDIYESDMSCFSTGCPDTGDRVDRMNLRLRPYDMDAYSTGEAYLELYAVRLYTD